MGLNGPAHRHFLADYYAGLYPMSDPRGQVVQKNLEIDAPQSLPRWVVPVANWAVDALSGATPLTDDSLLVSRHGTFWFVQGV